MVSSLEASWLTTVVPGGCLDLTRPHLCNAPYLRLVPRYQFGVMVTCTTPFVSVARSTYEPFWVTVPVLATTVYPFGAVSGLTKIRVGASMLASPVKLIV